MSKVIQFANPRIVPPRLQRLKASRLLATKIDHQTLRENSLTARSIRKWYAVRSWNCAAK